MKKIIKSATFTLVRFTWVKRTSVRKRYYWRTPFLATFFEKRFGMALWFQFGSLLAPFWLHFGHFGLPFGTFGLPLAPFWIPFTSFWLTFGTHFALKSCFLNSAVDKHHFGNLLVIFYKFSVKISFSTPFSAEHLQNTDDTSDEGAFSFERYLSFLARSGNLP